MASAPENEHAVGDENVLFPKRALFRRSEPPKALIIGCVLGAIFVLVTSVSLLYWYLSRTRWSRKPSPYPFTSPEAVSYPSSSTGTVSTPPRSEIYRMKRVVVPTSTIPTVPVNASGSKKVVGSVWETRNPLYCAPQKNPPSSSGTKSSTSHASKSSSSRARSGRIGSVAATQTVSSISFAHDTERQMELDERIEKLNESLFSLQRTAPGASAGTFPRASMTIAKMTYDHQVMSLKGIKEKLENLKESEWALGLTDELPPGLYEPNDYERF
ncbi:hypothetical protein E1B28_006776 [Marasmius oreades]|uniref:Uncharacterized protein n=1 Tax=Marasmius oreades TaxID=181124 RepID=A0A9P7UWT6_9AGAR|nr:uncharacterized protein E1B28_006776 [Marasmius oreades]KAG7096100.1 hypothetical protein E1B28_006776 [Marasmius oreades]